MPIGRPVKLIMGSEDVIHSFFIPAFRVKADVVPGRYNTMWFTATKPGTLPHLLHAVLRHQALGHDRLGHGDGAGRLPGVAERRHGRRHAWRRRRQKLFADLACITCHLDNGQGRGPVLKGVFGKQVLLATARRSMADDAYLRESILNPQAKVVAGFQPIMPTFQGLVTEEQLLQLDCVREVAQPATSAGGEK